MSHGAKTSLNVPNDMDQKRWFLIHSSTGIWRAFRDSYNPTWLVKRHGFITPDAFRQKQLQSAAKTAFKPVSQKPRVVSLPGWL
jgi:hypothetical protein